MRTQWRCVTSGRARVGPPSAYRCGGSSGWERVCRTVSLLIPVELSRQTAETSTNGLDYTRAMLCRR
jgi:hypothetical protein